MECTLIGSFNFTNGSCGNIIPRIRVSRYSIKTHIYVSNIFLVIKSHVVRLHFTRTSLHKYYLFLSVVTTDVPTPPGTTSPTITSSHNRSDTSTKSPLDLTPTTSITNETSGSTEEDNEPISGSNNTIVYVIAAVIVLLIAILVLLLIIYLVRRKMRKQAATRQSGEEGDVKLQSINDSCRD